MLRACHVVGMQRIENMKTDVPLRLLRLTSSLLPVGAFAYSRGLEHAVEARLVTDSEGLRSWVFGTLEQSFATLDGALFLHMMSALEDGAHQEFQRFDRILSASRESQELLLEDRRMAEALLVLLRDLDVSGASDPSLHCETFPAAYALAVCDLEVASIAGFHGLAWSVCEAQIAAAIRLGLVGQTDGQRILSEAPTVIAECARIARDTPVEDAGNVCFMLSVASALHETQHTRLFRS